MIIILCSSYFDYVKARCLEHTVIYRQADSSRVGSGGVYFGGVCFIEFAKNIEKPFCVLLVIGFLAEESFIRLASDVKSPKADTNRRIKELIAFSTKILESCKLSKSAANSLRERRLDGLFLIGDYDGAIAMLDKGLESRTPEWCKSTAAKLRAHKAIETGDKKEAIKQLLVFIDYMLSDAEKDFEDNDPANGVVYSREWIVAKNYMRCATLSGESGDAKAKTEFTEKAKPLYKTALEKAKDDEISVKELKREMKSYGL